MRRLVALLPLALAAGCGASDPHSGYALEVDVVAGPMVTAEVAAEIADVDVVVSGAESFQSAVPVAGQLAGGGTVRFVYHPSSPPGTMLDVGATARAADGSGLAAGMASAALVADQTARVTVTLGGTPGDGGVCTATACTGGDGCCPAGCNSTTDPDCAPVCGNGVIETNEVCDDGNTMNGDGCDPTCRHTNKVTVLSGVPGSNSYADRPNGRESRLGIPFSIAVDAAADPNTAFVTESVLGGLIIFANQPSCMIRQVDLTTGATTTLAGKPFECRVTDGDFKKARFNFLRDIERIGNRVFAVDLGPGMPLLRLVDLSAKTVSTFTITGATLTPGVTGLGSDGTHLLVLDSSGGRLLSVDPASGAATVIASSGFAGSLDVTAFGGNYYVAFGGGSVYQITPGGVVTTYLNSGITQGVWLAHDASNNLYISESQKQDVLKGAAPLTPPGPASPYAGVFGVSGFLDAAPPTSAQFHLGTKPFMGANFNGGGLIQAGGNLFVVDSLDSAIRKITPGAVSTLAGYPASNADNYGSTSTYSAHATAITTDGANAYLAQTNGVRKVSLADGSSSQFYVPAQPFDGLVRLGNALYGTATSSGNILKVPLDGSLPSAAAGPFAGGGAGHAADGCAAVTGACTTAAVVNPTAIATDGTALYFIDRKPFGSAYATVRKLDLAAGMVTTLAGDADYTAIVDGTGTAARFGYPLGLTCDGPNLYTLDSPDGSVATVVRRIEIATGAVTTLAGQAGGFGATDDVGTGARFAGATDLATDGRSLLIADPGQDPALAFGPAMRQLDLKTRGVTTAFGVRGQWTFAAGTGTGAYVNQPAAITWDATTRSFYFYDDVEGVVGRMQ